MCWERTVQRYCVTAPLGHSALQSGFRRGLLILRPQGVQIPRRVDRAGHYILSVVDFRGTHRGGRRIARRRRPRLPIWFKLPDSGLRSCPIVVSFTSLPESGLHLPYTPDGPYRFDTPLTFAACDAVSRGDSENCRLMGPKKIVMESRAKWGPCVGAPNETGIGGFGGG